MMAFIRKFFGIVPRNTSELQEAAKQARQLKRLSRSERTDKLFETLISEVRK